MCLDFWGALQFVHGLQFEAGQIYFARNSASEKWYTQGMTIGIEYDAFAGQQIKESWWQPGNTTHNTAMVNKLYPSLIGKAPNTTEPWSQRLVLRTPTYFGISLPKKYPKI